MKIMIAVDAEGVACVVGERGKSLGKSRDLAFAQEEATLEANAVAAGLFAAGVDEVVVWDNHNGSLNLDYRRIDERCSILCGVGEYPRMSLIREEFDGVVLLGYHAMEGTADAVLAHSYSSAMYQHIRVNGREYGEMEIDGAIAGEAGVPVILVASDDAGCREAREFFPHAELVSTKRGLGRNMALSKSPGRVASELTSAAEKALRGRADMKPFTIASPIRLEIRFQRADAAESKSRTDRRFRRTDAYTVEAEVDSITELF